MSTRAEVVIGVTDAHHDDANPFLATEDHDVDAAAAAAVRRRDVDDPEQLVCHGPNCSPCRPERATASLDDVHLVVAAALVRDGRVLLGHRSPHRRWYPDVWDVLGGHVDGDETPPEALIRELEEEAGVTVDVDLGEPLVRIVDPDGQDGLLDITIWVVTSWHGELVNREPDEHDELRWFTRDELPTLRMAHARLPALLDRVLAGSGN